MQPKTTRRHDGWRTCSFEFVHKSCVYVQNMANLIGRISLGQWHLAHFNFFLLFRQTPKWLIVYAGFIRLYLSYVLHSHLTLSPTLQEMICWLRVARVADLRDWPQGGMNLFECLFYWLWRWNQGVLVTTFSKLALTAILRTVDACNVQDFLGATK